MWYDQKQERIWGVNLVMLERIDFLVIITRKFFIGNTVEYVLHIQMLTSIFNVENMRVPTCSASSQITNIITPGLNHGVIPTRSIKISTKLRGTAS